MSSYSSIYHNLLQRALTAVTITIISITCRYFESIALGILNECFLVDEAKAKSLLIGVLSSYGETTPLQLAIEAENKAFISHQCCQNLLNNIWWGRLDELQGKWRVSYPIVNTLFHLNTDMILFRHTSPSSILDIPHHGLSSSAIFYC